MLKKGRNSFVLSTLFSTGLSLAWSVSGPPLLLVKEGFRRFSLSLVRVLGRGYWFYILLIGEYWGESKYYPFHVGGESTELRTVI